MDWQQFGLIIGAVSPLVGVPLVMVTFYLRAIREHQIGAAREMLHRIEALESSLRDVLRATAEFEREYTTKEEWVRESMLARQGLERLTEMVTRIQADLETSQTLATELGRLTASLVQAAGTMPRTPSEEQKIGSQAAAGR